MEQSLFRHLGVEDPIPQEAGAEPPVLRCEEVQHTLRVLLVLLLPGAAVRLHARGAKAEVCGWGSETTTEGSYGILIHCTVASPNLRKSHRHLTHIWSPQRIPYLTPFSFLAINQLLNR